jgi:hypothetical protein
MTRETTEQELQQLSAYHHLRKNKAKAASNKQTATQKKGRYHRIYLCARMRNWGCGELPVLEKMDVLLRQWMLRLQHKNHTRLGLGV